MTYVIADMTYCPPVLKTRVPSPLPGQHVWLNVSRLDQAEQFKSYRDAMIAYTDLIKCGHLHEQICIVYTGNLGAAGENRDVAASKEPKILAKLAAQLAAVEEELGKLDIFSGGTKYTILHGVKKRLGNIINEAANT